MSDQKYSSKFWDDDAIFICGNCEKRYLTEHLEIMWPEIPHLLQRIEPGGEVPSGECPTCGALVYAQKKGGK